MDGETVSVATGEARPPLAAVENVTDSTAGKSAANSPRAVKAVNGETLPTAEGKIATKGAARHLEETGEVEQRDGERQEKEREETDGERKEEDMDVDVAAALCKKGEVELSKTKPSKDTLENPRDGDASDNSTVHEIVNGKDSDGSPDEKKSVGKTSNESQIINPVNKKTIEENHANEDVDDNTNQRIAHKEPTDKESTTSKRPISAALVENNGSSKNDLTVESEISGNVADHDTKSLTSEDSEKVKDPDATSKGKERDVCDSEHVAGAAARSAAVDMVNVALMAGTMTNAITLSGDKQEQPKDQQEPGKDEEAPRTDEQSPAKDEQGLAAGDELAPAKNEQAPAKDEQAPAKNEQAPAKNEQAPAKNEQAPARYVPAPAKNEQAPAKNEQAPARYEPAPAKNEQAPSKDEQAPSKDEQAPSKDEQAPSKDEQAPATDEPAGPFQDIPVPPHLSRKEHEALLREMDTLYKRATKENYNFSNRSDGIRYQQQEAERELKLRVRLHGPVDPRKLLAHYTADALNLIYPVYPTDANRALSTFNYLIDHLINLRKQTQRHQPQWEFAGRLDDGIRLLKEWMDTERTGEEPVPEPHRPGVSAAMLAALSPYSPTPPQPQTKHSAHEHFMELARELRLKQAFGWTVDKSMQLEPEDLRYGGLYGGLFDPL